MVYYYIIAATPNPHPPRLTQSYMHGFLKKSFKHNSHLVSFKTKIYEEKQAVFAL